MQVCPFCRILLLDTDSTCPRDGHAGEPLHLEPLSAAIETQLTSIETFAQGGTGTLYQATRRDTGERGLLKVVQFPSGAYAAERKRMQRELGRQRNLRGSALAPAKISGHQDGGLWLFRDWVPGESLKVRLHKRGPLPVPQVLAIIAQVAAGLDELHRAGLLHRDIKPGHIIVQDEASGLARATLIDAGIAARIETGGVFDVYGTPAYVSPEQVGGKLVNFRSDLYALGCVMYEMLAGAPPFGGGIEALLEAHQQTAPQPLDAALDPAIASLLESLLAKDPRERPFSAQHVRRILEPRVPEGTPLEKGSGAAVAGVGADPHRADTKVAPMPAASETARVQPGPSQPPPTPEARHLPPAPAPAGASSTPPPVPGGGVAPLPETSDTTQVLKLSDLMEAGRENVTEPTQVLKLSDLVEAGREDVPDPTLALDPADLVEAEPGEDDPTVALSPGSLAQAVGSGDRDPTLALDPDDILEATEAGAAAPASGEAEPAPEPAAGVKSVVGSDPWDALDISAGGQAEAPAPEPAGEAPGEDASAPAPGARRWPRWAVPAAVAGVLLLLGGVSLLAGGEGPPATGQPAGADEPVLAQAEPRAEPEDDGTSAAAHTAAPSGAIEDEASAEVPAADEANDAPGQGDEAQEGEGEAKADQEALAAADSQAAEDGADAEQAIESAGDDAAQERAPSARASADRGERSRTHRARASQGRKSRLEQAAELRERARKHYQARRYREAARAYQRATELAPSHAGGFAGLGASLLALSDPRGALRAYQRAVQIAPGSSGFHAALGRAYYTLGDEARAEAAYRRAVSLNPNNTIARAALSRIAR